MPSRILCCLLVALAIASIDAPAALGQRARNSRDIRWRRRDSRQKQQPRVSQQTVAPKASAVYKRGTPTRNVRLDFAVSGDQWPQPNGLGSPITITYSYSNLLNGSMSGLTSQQLRQGIEEALALWAGAAPLNFVEVTDSGPAPSDAFYAAGDTPQIRIGHHTLDGAAGPELAHAYLPYSATDGRAGDLHFDSDEDWSIAQGGYFLETAIHEIGHTLGLEHELIEDAVMNPELARRFDGLGSGELLRDDVLGIQEIYGEGIGSVTPLEQDPETDDPTDPTEPLAGVSVESNDETGGVSITGDDEDNAILMVSLWRFVIVVGLDETPINGESTGWAAMSNEGLIHCDLGGGDDSVWTFRLCVDELSCDLGEGDDTLGILFSSIGQLVASGGADQDRLVRFFARIEEQTATEFE